MVDTLSFLPRAIAAVAPHADVAAWSSVLGPEMQKAGIANSNECAVFLGQLAVESAFFERTEEVLNYTNAQHIFETFGHAFSSAADAIPFVRSPEALGNRVYANENGNGDEASGDGWRCRGRGLIQITGLANYEAFAKAMGMTLDAAIAFASTPAGAAASACWYWTARGLNPLAAGLQITAVTRRINPALAGLRDRIALADAALAVFGGDTIVSRAVPRPPSVLVESEANRLMDQELEQLNPSAAGSIRAA